VRQFEIVRYGADPDQFGQLWPAAGAGPAPAPVVVLLHGGYWRRRYGLDLMQPLAADLSARGYAVWNLEYRRVGAPGGGWPGTFLDVAAGLDALVGLAGRGLDPAGVAVVGHSAGGHLALWACDRPRVGGAEPAGPRLRPAFAVSLAGVCDLIEAARRRLSGGAVLDLLGGDPERVPDRYRRTCPTLLLPFGVRQLVVHGTDDADVPFAFGRRYAAAAGAAGDECELLALPEVGHFALIDPGSAAWAAVAERLDGWRHARLPAPASPDR
jgi:acetyl esterase/lipase